MGKKANIEKAAIINFFIGDFLKYDPGLDIRFIVRK